MVLTLRAVSNPMQEAFVQILVEHNLVSPGDRVLVAVSGGADSVALLHLLHRLAPTFPLTLCVAHLDHALRPESADDLLFVQRLCERFALPFVSSRESVAEMAEQRGVGLEEAGRDARRSFLTQTAARHDCRWIALGHHRGDQAETVVHRLLRGSALSGLAGMRLKNGPFIRPLLSFSRQQLLDYLDRQGLPHVQDKSNDDFAYTRNRIRHQVLPVLQSLNPAVEEHLAHLARRIESEEDYWAGEERRVLETLARRRADGLWLDCKTLAEVHPALRLRVIRRALGEVRGSLAGLGRLHLEAVASLLGGLRPQREVHLPGAWVGRRYRQLWLRRFPPVIGEPYSLPIPGPGSYPLPGGAELTVSLVETGAGEDRWSVEFDASLLRFPLTVRTFANGDRFHPAGAAGGKKLKDFLIDSKIPREERRSLPLVVGETILWVAGVRRCHGLRPDSGGAAVVRMVLKMADCPTIGL
ncbi:tRNA(Ile)-lysidine synthetase [Desulfuromonas soudanensis]|uniref:tRNA(Ile)-lysidine synthase n=1 Tax=Desulfuromonas soudanensis TaxID=1603606 RepID=A0A0M3QG84_9BACT|nr:tRNA lysidine(34) synthetase TilS [Desulfuromonas soudanensis]ALC17539.1 tRNA(Ile)-lysidine synthetase [Desulfuromonas soudanensis]